MSKEKEPRPTLVGRDERGIPIWKFLDEDKKDAEEIKEELKEKELSPEAKKKLDDVKADLKDDGKLNHSNDPKKKSPGRKRKKK